jgi:pyruvate dehydrogenase E1 component beta subunit
VPLGEPRVTRSGEHVTIVAVSYMTLEALRAAELLAEDGVSAEVIDVRTLKPLDDARLLESVRKTGHLIVADIGWKTSGFGAELTARVVEKAFGDLKAAPKRVTSPDLPTPTTSALADHYYPRAVHIVAAAREMLRLTVDGALLEAVPSVPLDVPDMSFTGPF